MQTLLYIFLGGGLGSLSRYAIGQYFSSQSGFPWATFLANILACTLLGLLLGYELKHGMKSEYKLLLATGFCGGFSTFSTFSAESLKLLQAGHTGTAIAYVGISLLAGLIAVYMGLKLIEFL